MLDRMAPARVPSHTVMSTNRNLKLIQNASEKGFFIRTYIVLTCDSAVNVSRVHGRVQSGGHDVPVEKIISRYDRSLRLVKDVIVASHVCNIYDNSSQYQHPFRYFFRHGFSVSHTKLAD